MLSCLQAINKGPMEHRIPTHPTHAHPTRNHALGVLFMGDPHVNPYAYPYIPCPHIFISTPPSPHVCVDS